MCVKIRSIGKHAHNKKMQANAGSAVLLIRALSNPLAEKRAVC